MYVVITLIVINIICYFIALQIQHAELIFGLNSLFITEKFYWQPLSSMFMHGNLTHLAMNMIVLFQFGSLLEKSKGSFFFLLLYIIGGIITSLFTSLFMEIFNFDHVVVGASGALCVIIGYLSYIEINLRKGLFISILIISFVPLFFGMPIAWYAHLIGFCLGYLFGEIKKRKYI